MKIIQLTSNVIRCIFTIFFLTANTLASEAPEITIDKNSSLEDELSYLAPKRSINLDSRLSSFLNDRGYGLRQSYVSISGEIEQELRAVITLNIGHLFSSGELTPNENFNLSQFVREAYIEIRNFNGKPYAFVLGKRPITFGQNLEQMPFFERNPLYREMFLQDVFGFTVELTEGLLGALDTLEFTVYETGRNDLKIKELGSYAFRGQKYISKNTLINIGYSSESTSGNPTKRRFNVGIVGTSKNGKLLAWLEGILYNEDRGENELRFGLTSGMTYILNKRTKLVIESTMIQNLLYQLGIGAKVNLTKNLTLGLEGRLTLYPGNRTDYFYGINLTHLFDSTLYETKQEPNLFEDDYEL